MKYLSTGKVYTWAPKETEHLGQRLIAQSASSGQTTVSVLTVDSEQSIMQNGINDYIKLPHEQSALTTLLA